MKNKVLIIALGFFIFSFGNIAGTYAQDGEDGGTKIGFRFMPTFSSFEVSTPDEETIKGEFTLGYGYGGLLGVYFSENFGLQAEVIYSTLAQKYSRAEFEGRVELDYLNIPLLLSYNTGLQEPFNFNIVAGPQIGINMGANVDQEGDDTYEALLQVKDSDIGLAYGAGIDFALDSEGDVRLALGFRGVYGLVDISDDSGTKETDSFYVLRKTNLETYSGYIGLSFIL